jgi:transcriptional regulator NrdR family protein
MFKCPECNVWTEVIDTRLRSDGSRRRRYQCGNLHKFWTIEAIVPGPSSTATAKTEALQKIEEEKQRVMLKLKVLEKP